MTSPDDIARTIANTLDGEWHDSLDAGIEAAADGATITITIAGDGGEQRFTAVVIQAQDPKESSTHDL